MRAFALTAALLILAGSISASSPGRRFRKSESAFQKGNVLLSGGIGFPALFVPNTDSLLIYGSLEKKNSLPFYFKGEYAITDNIGAGLMFALNSSKVTVTDNTDPTNVDGFDYSYTTIALRAAWHQNLNIDNLDAYGALMAGLVSTGPKPFGPYNYFNSDKKTFMWGIYVGANYFFIPLLGVHAEVGYGFSVANVGITVKF